MQKKLSSGRKLILQHGRYRGICIRHEHCTNLLNGRLSGVLKITNGSGKNRTEKDNNFRADFSFGCKLYACDNAG